MNRPTRSGTAAARLAALLTAAVCGLGLFPTPALALSIDEYFAYSYSLELSKTAVQGSEAFSATVTGTAICRKDLPLVPNEARVTSRIVARHAESGATVALHEGYTLTLTSFPARQGESVEKAVTLLLAFPEGAPPGAYDVVAELVEASIHVVVWLEITNLLPQSEVLGAITYEAPPGEPTPVEPPASPGDGEGPASPEDAAADTEGKERAQAKSPDDADDTAERLPAAPVPTPAMKDVEGQDVEGDGPVEAEGRNQAPTSPVRAISLVISPARASAGQPVTVSAVVVNSGEADASSAISLLLDGKAVDMVEVQLSGGEVRELDFTIAASVLGAHQVAVAGLTGTFTVVEIDVAAELPASTGGAAWWVVSVALGVGGVLAGLLVARRKRRTVGLTR